MPAQTIKQKADAEAARAEAENPDEPETTEPGETPDEAEPANPDAEPSEEEQEAEEEQAAEETQAAPADSRSDEQTQKMFDRAVSAFRAKLADVFGVDDLTPSSTPGVIGFVLPGFTEHKTHENYIRCQTCNGWGQVLTGSLHVGDETANCPACAGRGYLEKLTPANAPPPQSFAAPAAVTGPTVYEQPAPNGQPEYGVPSYMGDPNLKPAG